MKYPVSAQRFREVLAERNMQAQELAARSGLSKAAISQYVNGSRCPTNRTALILGDILQVSPLWLMALSDEKFFTPPAPVSQDRAELVSVVSRLSEDEVKYLLLFLKAIGK